MENTKYSLKYYEKQEFAGCLFCARIIFAGCLCRAGIWWTRIWGDPSVEKYRVLRHELTENLPETLGGVHPPTESRAGGGFGAAGWALGLACELSGARAGGRATLLRSACVRRCVVAGCVQGDWRRALSPSLVNETQVHCRQGPLPQRQLAMGFGSQFLGSGPVQPPAHNSTRD
jgi:hypothetical protein